MLPRRFRRAGAQDEREEKTVAQDGFSATVLGVSPRPWRQEAAQPLVPGLQTSLSQQPQQTAPAAQTAPGQQGAYARPAARGAMPSQAAYAMVGRRVLDFADNGDGTYTVVRCIDPAADDLDIQFEAGACPVVAIGPRAFEGCTALRRVILPAGLRQIGEMAFSGCAHLKRVVIPSSVQRVGTLAFAKCAELERVRIEPGVQALGPSCFSKCTHLMRVDMPASLTAFGGGVFFGCGKQLCLYGAEGTPAQQYAKLNGVAFDSESWKEDEQMIFAEQEDGSLIVTGARQEAPERIEIPSELCGRRIAAIAPKAFFACGSLAQVIIGANVKEIGDGAFFGCRSLSSAVFERGIERIGDNAFAGCENLTQVTLPWGTASVGRMAFFGCTRLSFVKMPTTTRVSDFAFDGCSPSIRVFGGVSAGRAQDMQRAERCGDIRGMLEIERVF